MKYIISQTGSVIDFKLSGTRHLMIDPIVPIQVEDEEYKVLDSRLGCQLGCVLIGETKTKPVEENKIEEQKKEEEVKAEPVKKVQPEPVEFIPKKEKKSTEVEETV